MVGKWLANGWPMVGQLLADCWPMVCQWLSNGLQIVGHWLTNGLPMAGQKFANGWPMVGEWLANGWRKTRHSHANTKHRSEVSLLKVPSMTHHQDRTTTTTRYGHRKFVRPILATKRSSLALTQFSIARNETKRFTGSSEWLAPDSHPQPLIQ